MDHIPEHELHALYQWVRGQRVRVPAAVRDAGRAPAPQVDDIPLSRPKKNIARDFSDGGAR